MAPVPHNNGDVDAARLVGVSNESTPLVNNDMEAQSEGSGSTGTPQDVEVTLWEEMDAPWPATFERSISLLASPVIKAEKAKDFTKSPKPGNTPIALRRRMLVSRIMFGFFIVFLFLAY